MSEARHSYDPEDPHYWVEADTHEFRRLDAAEIERLSRLMEPQGRFAVRAEPTDDRTMEFVLMAEPPQLPLNWPDQAPPVADTNSPANAAGVVPEAEPDQNLPPVANLADNAVELAADRPKLFGSTMLMASGTLVSRILGMVRVLIVARLLTVIHQQGDMFAIASEIPSTAYMLLAGGVLNAILVPQLMRAMSQDKDGGQAFSDRIVTLFGLLLVGLTAILMIGAPLILRVMTGSEWRSPTLAAHYHSMLWLTVLCLPQIFFFGMFFLWGQILNARGSFGPLAWAPVANNVIQILMLGMYAIIYGFHADQTQPFSHAQILILGLGSVAGVACQAAILIPYLKKLGFRYKPRFDFLHTGLASTAHLAKWALALAALDQVNYLVITRLMSTATTGGKGAGVAAFSNAMLVSLVPHALLTVSLATALMPALSSLSVAKRLDRFAGQFLSSIRTIYAAMVPISLLMIALAVPACTLAFGAGNGGAYAGRTLVVLAIGIIPFTLRFLVTKGFNAMANTRTPFFVELVFVGVTCLVSLSLVVFLRVPQTWYAPSIAVGYCLGYLVSGVYSWILFRRCLPGLRSTSLAIHTGRLIVISIPGAVLAALVCWLQEKYLPGLLPGLIGLVISAILGIGVYWGLAKAIKVTEIQDLETMIRSKLRKESAVEPLNPGTGRFGDDANQRITGYESSLPGPEPDYTSSRPVTSLDTAGVGAAGVGRGSPETGYELRGPGESDSLSFIPGYGIDDNQPVLTGLAPLVPGMLIAERYRLSTLVGKVGEATRWSGTDEALSRPVFITCFANNAQTQAILKAAGEASGAMDAHFLHVLDAKEGADGAYVVTEKTEGKTLAELLQRGPLGGEEAAWVVREVAAALATIHATNLFHCRLDPTEVVISANGGVKILGLGVDHALTPRANDAQLTRAQLEALDVISSGALLYACLTATWIGNSNVGLPSSPRDARGLQPPRNVRPAVPVALDQVTRQILTVNAPGHIATAAAIADSLSAILGPTVPVQALAARVGATPGAAESTAEVLENGNHGPGLASQASLVEPVRRPHIVPEGTPPAAKEHSMSGKHRRGDDTVEPLHHPITADKARWWSRIFLSLIVVVVLALVTALVVGLYNVAHRSPAAPASTGSVHAVVSAQVFDPAGDGGDNSENDDMVSLAYDNDPATAWLTEEYGATYIPNNKPGVGLLFNLGSAVPVSQIGITILNPTITVSVYVPQGDPATTTPDLTSIKNWTSLTSANLTTAKTTLTMPSTTTQFVVIYITQLASKDDYYQGDLAEVSFTG